ncbi:MAG TPA: hypothetical protein VM408_03465 [Methylomirabilota bacterium]|nr:hypothetical protein [Methylomirabilota bacterium]
MTPKVLGVVGAVLTSLGADEDPRCWIVWGDDPGVRYVVLAPTDAGLVQVLVRVNVPGEGPRASAKVIRWSRLQLGELGLEMVSGHRLLGFQVESHVLRGSDDQGDAMAAFALELFARVDGRAFTPRPDKRARSVKGGASRRPKAAGVQPAATPTARKPAPASRKPRIARPGA